MRTVALLLFSLLSASVCLAADITTRKGVTYKQATVTKLEPDAVRISYVDGVARIPLEDLPDALQRQYNYEPAKVAAYRKQVADAQKAATDRAAAEQRQRQEAVDRAARTAHEQAEAKRVAAQREAEERAAAEESAKANEALLGFVGMTVAVLGGLFVYFIPTIIGFRKRNAGAIFVANLLLGWICIGWVLALIWACTKDSAMETMADQHLKNQRKPSPGPCLQ